MEYLAIIDGSYSKDGYARCSFAVYSVLGEMCSVHGYARLIHMVRMADTGLPVAGDTSMQAEAYALYSLLIYLDSQRIFKSDNRIVIITDCLPMLEQLTGRTKVTSQPLLNVYQKIFKYLSGISKRIKFDVWDLLDFRWMPGTEMKQTILGH